MSVRLMTLVWDCPRLTDPGETLVMLAFADWANDGGVCWPAMGTLAERARYAERRSVRRVVQRLVERGALVVHPSAGTGSPHVYAVSLDWLCAPVEEGEEGKGERGKGREGEGVTAAVPAAVPPAGPAPTPPGDECLSRPKKGLSRLIELVGPDAPGLARVTAAMPAPVAVWTAVAGEPPLTAMWPQLAAWIGAHPLALETLRDVLHVAVAGGWRLTNVLNVRDAWRREFDARRGAAPGRAAPAQAGRPGRGGRAASPRAPAAPRPKRRPYVPPPRPPRTAAPPSAADLAAVMEAERRRTEAARVGARGEEGKGSRGEERKEREEGKEGWEC